MLKGEELLRLVYHLLLGAALLLLSAVAEGGDTEMSRSLVHSMTQVPQMIEALVAGMTLAVGGGTLAAYIDHIDT
ncbi:MAG: hypothetical protein IKN38_07815 [Clostridia bacterium]|nr:hypothetical protein [Clostridia bacterium]